MNTVSPDYRVYEKPELRDSTLLVCWDDDAGKLGQNVYRFLSSNLRLKLFAEIEPTDYFPLSGVSVEKDVAEFPESKFYCFQDKNLVIFKSSVPRFEWYRFITSVLDLAQKVCNVKELLTIGGMVSISSHNIPREIMATMNTPEIKDTLKTFQIALNMDYETPPGQRPTMSSYLLWSAIQRKIWGISLWVPVPFYLVNVDDLRSCRMLLGFLDKRLQLGLEMKDIDEAISNQNKKILDISKAFPEVEDIFRKLETNITLDQTETNKVMEIIEDRLR